MKGLQGSYIEWGKFSNLHCELLSEPARQLLQCNCYEAELEIGTSLV